MIAYTASAEFLAGHRSLRESAVMCRLDRSLLEISGAERAAFLHNMATNDIRSLQPGSGCETFFTNVQGKVLGFGEVYCHEESLALATAAEQAEKLLAHLDRYIIREDVQLADRTGDWIDLLVAGPGVPEVLTACGADRIPDQRLQHVTWNIGPQATVTLARVAMAGSHDWLLRGEQRGIELAEQQLAEAGCIAVGADVVNAARIEAGTPRYGTDISEQNLPQEVDRDYLAISFTAGCYLGQETVARIDALGHVNKMLRGLRFPSGTMPGEDTLLKAGDRQVGSLTSVAYSPQLDAALALGYVRRGHNEPGTQLQSDLGEVQVLKLPLPGI